ncbi:putative exported protein [Pectobacterium atrosepticum SCRI1043]|uniref:Exported protein n=1 Tax=Pectobacterium atrosepticum (strain SCRI 1043 / ATCC BAA-672) TaxID=218491 RepID=Q6D130_PECAS|nr:hypothetical protein [Pectobacterium atrosepticum]GKV86757.1 hypothetical protein PEC301296_30680 [Pectobacterium carotovorum subsp. carotovorum]AIA72405.1 hypothetical protein EV46_17955 [Pectobacterium atrosepticum]AIK15385.1 putative exported protein [Pectobacterium atrosepticum]ATY92143.1 hypothetical protein CVS35_18220 [Pectobacterium atrosepticum]KFX14580.1 hypothetical protein JV34_12190 [Pectobacterium atrosepticum]
MHRTISRFIFFFFFITGYTHAVESSLHELDSIYQQCRERGKKSPVTLPSANDWFWTLNNDDKATALIYLNEKAMNRCTESEVDKLAIKAFHLAVEGKRSFLDTLIAARTTTLQPLQQQWIESHRDELNRLGELPGLQVPFSLSQYFKVISEKK